MYLLQISEYIDGTKCYIVWYSHMNYIDMDYICALRSGELAREIVNQLNFGII